MPANPDKINPIFTGHSKDNLLKQLGQKTINNNFSPPFDTTPSPNKTIDIYYYYQHNNNKHFSKIKFPSLKVGWGVPLYPGNKCRQI